MTVDFFLSGCDVKTSEHDPDTTFVRLLDRAGGEIVFLISAKHGQSERALAVADAFRAAALKHMPAPNETPDPVEVATCLS